MIPNISLQAAPKPQPVGKVRKLLKHLSGDDYLLEIDNTSLSSFTMCPREAEYRLVHSRNGEGSYALTYGKAIHASLEHYYKSKLGQPTAIGEASPDFMSECVGKGLAILETDPPPIGEWRCADTLQNAILKYIKKYSCEDNFEVLAVEQPFAMPLAVFPVNGVLPYDKSMLVADCADTGHFIVDNIHVSWTGVIDLVLRDSLGLWILDHKTSSRNDSGLWNNFELTPQFQGYCWSAEKILNERLLGAKANVIFGRKPAAKGTGTPLELERQNFHYKPEHIEEWESNTKLVISEFLHSLTTSNFNMHTNNCIRKYGSCQFHEVCKMVPQNRMTMLYSGAYVSNTWNPLD